MDMPEATTDNWTDLMVRLVELQGLPVTVRVTEMGARVAELRGHLHYATGFKAEPDAVLLWVGRSLPSVSFAVSREFLSSWWVTEDDGLSELRMHHGPTKITVDFSPGAGQP